MLIFFNKISILGDSLDRGDYVSYYERCSLCDKKTIHTFAEKIWNRQKTLGEPQFLE